MTGTIGIDTVHTPHGSMEGASGGSCAYFAAAASFHAPVRVVAAVGGDWPLEHRNLLESFEGVDLRGLEHRAASKTFAWGGRYFDQMNQRETLFTELGVLEEDPPAIPDAFADSEFIFLANTHPAVQLGLLDAFPRRRLAVADTMDLWINIAHEPLMTLLSRIDGLIINDAEAQQLTEHSNAVSAARAILEYGPAFVVIKKGEHGCVMVHQDGIAVLPAFPADQDQVVDPTGAGDSFAGGFMGHIAAGGVFDFNTLQTALAFGTVTASFTIESFGLDRLREISRADVDARLHAFRRMARVC
ncbi:MAG: PfkB family carbohydrate kinase [Phycisphaerales bacterium]